MIFIRHLKVESSNNETETAPAPPRHQGSVPPLRWRADIVPSSSLPQVWLSRAFGFHYMVKAFRRRIARGIEASLREADRNGERALPPPQLLRSSSPLHNGGEACFPRSCCDRWYAPITSLFSFVRTAHRTGEHNVQPGRGEVGWVGPRNCIFSDANHSMSG